MSARPDANPADWRLAFIVPAFNAAATLGRTLASLSAQTRPDWSAVVVDDGSTDATGAIARGVGDPRVRVVRQENRGLAGARNTGLRHADAECVCFLDADDLVDPGFASAMLDALRDADAAACGYRFIDPDDRAIGDEQPALVGLLTLEGLLRCNPRPPASLAFRAGVLRRVLGEPCFREDLRTCEDWDAWVRLCRAGVRFGVVDRTLVSYRKRPGSLSTLTLTLWRDGAGVIERSGAAPEVVARAARAWAVQCLTHAAVNGRREDALELRRAVGVPTPADLDAALGALRWSLSLTPPDQGWRGRVEEFLAPLGPALLERSAGMTGGEGSWDDLARRLSERVTPGRTLVVYGLGRNGRRLVGAIARATPSLLARVRFCDDALPEPEIALRTPTGVVGLLRLDARELGERHTVVVTPDERSAILRRLDRAGVRDVLTLDDLARHAAA